MSRVSITWPRENSSPYSTTALVSDRSRGGMGICVHCHVEPGTPVKIEERGRTLSGVIRYCDRSATGYTAGIQYDQPDPDWDAPIRERRAAAASAARRLGNRFRLAFR